ncbi:hypothetical protein [Gilliamella sp. BG7]|uniref:hypothetical protein n=1 Tax=unclassified Gilliamella TaxID=2685620 RepID=UPI0039860B28
MKLTDISNFINNEITKRANNQTIKATLAVIDELTDITPVDTSNAMSNWQVSINGQITDQNVAFYFGSKGSTKHLSKMAVVNSALNALKERKFGDKIYIQNNASYIKKLDEGGSQQFAGGFVPKALIIFRSELRS